MLISIDNGFRFTKVRSQNRLHKFESRAQLAAALDRNVVTVGGKAYQVGSGADDIRADKTVGLVPRLCLLRALAEEEGNDFDVVLDLPIGHYYNNDFREAFRGHMGRSETIQYNGQKRDLRINSVRIYPQGLAALYAGDITRYKGRAVGVLDIGGLTIDGVVVDNLRPLRETMFSLNRGTLILENRIKTALNEAFLLNVSDYEIPYMIASGGIAAVPESKAVIESAIQEFVGQIRREMVVKGWSCETLPIVGIGGGAELLKDYLETVFIYEETGNPMFDNAIGLYELGACFK